MDSTHEPVLPRRKRDASDRGPGRLKWHHIYYVLAAFDLATLCFSLYLNHRILTIYTQSVLLNQTWAERMDSYSALAQMAAAVNAPGNDVFDTHDVKRESARLHAALGGFERSFAAAESDLRGDVDPALARPLRYGLDRVATTMRAMVSEAELIFTYFEQGAPDKAGRRMAAMDRTYGHLRTAFDALERDVREIQRGNLARQTSAAMTLGRYEYLIGGLLLLMVAAVTVYGRQLTGEMESHQRERERFLADLQEAEARTRAIVDTAADGILSVDDRERIVSFNAAAERIFGYRAEEVVGKEAKMLLARPHDGIRGRLFGEEAEAGEETGVVRPEGLRRDGTGFPVDLASSRVQVGGRTLVTVIVRDVTDRERAEALRRRYREELEARVRESTAHLEAALARQSELARKNAEAYEVIRRTQEELIRRERLAVVGEIAATVAHGLRNPLASIRAAAEVGREELAEDSPLGETLGDIVTEVSRLEKRIEGVLDFAHPFEPTLSAADVNDFLGGFAEGLRKRIPEAIDLVVELDPAVPQIEFDCAHMQEALEAIVLNAVEAVGPRGQVTVRSSLERGDNGKPWVTLSVADTGPGIDAPQIQRIFDLFYTNKPSGTGLGLAVAKRFVEGQGGRLEVSSQPSGTTFRIRLPVVRDAGGTRPSQGPEDAQVRR